MVALESMARACPPIVADTASMPESVGNAGLLAAPGDPVAFAESVINLHNNPELRSDLVKRGFEHLKQFRWDNCGQQFADLARQLMASTALKTSTAKTSGTNSI